MSKFAVHLRDLLARYLQTEKSKFEWKTVYWCESVTYDLQVLMNYINCNMICADSWWSLKSVSEFSCMSVSNKAMVVLGHG